MVAQDYKSHVDLSIPGMEYLFLNLSQDRSQLDEASEFVTSIGGLINAALESDKDLEEFAQTIESTGNATRLMRKVSFSIRDSILSIQTTSKKITAWKDHLEKIEVH